MTVLEVLKRSTSWLGERGAENPRLDAEILVAQGLGISRLDLYLTFDRVLDAEELAPIRDLIRRRGDLEPIAYITGEREFWSLAFEVCPGVLVPRPETEHVVEVALEALRALDGTPHIADVGIGSGCIAVALLSEIPAARAHGTDISAKALDTARRNAERHDVADRLTLHEGNLLDPLRADPVWGTLDVVVSNPPYVVRGDPLLDVGVARHEPEEALYVEGDDALAVARGVAKQAPEALRPGGLLCLELGYGSAESGIEMLEGLGYQDVRLVKDLGGIERVLVGRRA